MAIKNLVPRESGSGNLGTTSKPWEGIFSDSLSAGSLSATTITANSISTNIIHAGIISSSGESLNLLGSLVVSGDTIDPVEQYSMQVFSPGLATSATEPFIVLTGGNVGIRTNSPSANLTVNGSLSAANLTADSISAVSLTANFMTAGSITANALTANALTAASISAIAGLTSIFANFDSTTANTLSAGSISADSISAIGGLTSAFANLDSITATTISANSIRGSSQPHLWPGIFTGLSATSISAAGLTSSSISSGSITSTSIDTASLTTLSGTLNSITASTISASSLTAPHITPQYIGTLPQDDATPTLPVGNVFYTQNVSTTNYTNILGGSTGQVITIISDDADTSFSHGDSGEGGLVLSGGTNFEATLRSTLVLVRDRGATTTYKWLEISRSKNS